MPHQVLSNFVLLPELKLKRIQPINPSRAYYVCEKVSSHEVCPRCASLCHAIYDHRTVKVDDAPLRNKGVTLVIRKRRFWCKACRKPFTEPVQGILPRRRKTQRLRAHVLWACETFSDLKKVRHHTSCSNDFIYNALYEQLELKRRMQNQYPWPKAIGIDEHHFRRARGHFGPREFVSMIVDQKNKKLFEVVHGKSRADLWQALKDIPGRENVEIVVMDLCDPFKSFVQEFFPNAKIVADKFHVLRLMNPHINRLRKMITGDKRSNPVRKLLLRNQKNLKFHERSALSKWVGQHPQLHEVYLAKEALHRLFRTRGYNKAKRTYIKLLDHWALSTSPEIKRLRRTLMRWRKQILNYFRFRLTNARTEGFNNVAKVIKRRSYGFRNFNNYRLRLLYACS